MRSRKPNGPSLVQIPRVEVIDGAPRGAGCLLAIAALLGLWWLLAHARSKTDAPAPAPSAAASRAASPLLPAGRVTPGRTAAPSAPAFLRGLDEKKRRDALKAVLGAQPCGTVTQAFDQGTLADGSAAFWSVRCSSGAAYSVVLASDPRAPARVRDCAQVRGAGVTPCFARLR